MFKQMQTWWRAHQTTGLAQTLAAKRTGMQGMLLPLTPTTAESVRADLAQIIQTWLTEQLAISPTPYGVTRYTVCLAYIARDPESQQRQLLHRWQREIVDRQQAPTALAAAAQALLTEPIPHGTQAVEVYLFSMGAVVMALLDRTAPRQR